LTQLEIFKYQANGQDNFPKKFCCKSAQFCATNCEPETTETPGVSNAVQKALVRNI